MIEINNLHVNVEGREILKGLDLALPQGEVHAIMGPNGSGKSTLAYVLAGKGEYEVTAGTVTWKGRDLLAMNPSERAVSGVFLAFQYPMEIPGVATMTFLRTAVNAVRKARGEAELSTPDFLRFVRKKAKLLKIDPEMLKRPLNVGFSGGEKKRNEILQMALLEPALCVMDETDSGLDPAMRQAEHTIGVHGLGTQLGDPGIARAGETLLRRGEQVDIVLFGTRLELLDRKLHAVPLGCPLAELGVAGLFELERKLRSTRAGHTPVGEHMHPVRNDVVEQPLIVGDDEHGAVRRAKRVHAFGNDAHGVDVEA